jgi:hypothetical protein
VKWAAKLLSVSLIPTPKSAYFIANMSLAPSPTIPTLSAVRAKKRLGFGMLIHFSIFIYFSLSMTLALFYGEIRAKTLIFEGRVGFMLKNLLSMTIGWGWF